MTGSDADYENESLHDEATAGELLLESAEKIQEALAKKDVRRDQAQALRKLYCDLEPIAQAVRTDEKGGRDEW